VIVNKVIADLGTARISIEREAGEVNE